MKDVAVEEGESGVSFFQAGEGILLRLGDVLEEASDITGLEVVRMALVVKENQTARPVGMAFAGAVLAEAVESDLADEVEQARRLGRCQGGGRAAEG